MQKMYSGGMNPFTSRWYEYSRVASLLAVNLLAMALAFRERWDLAQVFWLYWVQSASMGIPYLLEALFGAPASIQLNVLDRFANALQNIGSATLFLVYYGGFHLIYALTLMQLGLSMPRWGSQPSALFALCLFFILHLSRFAVARIHKESLHDGGLGPMARILPMHVGLVLGAAFGGQGMVLVLMTMKSIIELATEWGSILSQKGTSAKK